MNVNYRWWLIGLFLVCLQAQAIESIKSSQKLNDNPDAAPDPTYSKTPAQEVKPYIASLSVFGSSRIDEKGIRAFLGKDLDAWTQEGLTGDPQKAIKMQLDLTSRVVKKYNLAFADWSILEYFQPGDLAIRVTLDVVEKKDLKERMPFRKAPIGQEADPGQLITTWQEYVTTALEIANKGGLDPFGDDCKLAFHCLFGHDHPKLLAFGNRFKDGVAKYESRLINVIQNDRDPEQRAAAVFLLAYMKDGNKLVSTMVQARLDPSPLVRNNALRVLGDIADLHPQIVIPAQPIIEALYFPTVTDRSKAVYTLYGMVENSKDIRKVVAKDGVVSLLRLLSSEQPNESEPAYAVLKRISGQEFAKKDYTKWQNWAQRLPAENKAK